MKTIRFALRMSPDGSVIYEPGNLAHVARRVAGIHELQPGGMIVLSTDVNAAGLPGILGKAKQKMKTWWNRLTKSRKVDENVRELLMKQGLETGWSVGNLFRGRYLSKSGQTFNEKSFAVDIRGVPFDFIKDAAETLRQAFDQEAVLVVDHSNNKTYIMD